MSIPPGIPIHLDQGARDRHQPLDAAIAVGPRPLARVGEHAARLVHLAGLEQRVAELRQDLQARSAPRGGKGGRPTEQVDRRRHVAALERLLPRGSEVVAGPVCELELGLADGAELRPIAKRLLEVVADNLRRAR